jgi:hypothetical protein
LQPRLEAHRGRAGVEVLKMFARSIRSFADRRYFRLYPQPAPRR